ncbi:MAG: Uma2 family endonuclease, partial [Caldilineaceae bacterium]
EVIVMSPAGSKTSARNAGITGQLWQWNEERELGITFDSSGGFHLPNGADRSPDAAWILAERWNALTSHEQQKFAPICPDFVVELRSSSDSMPDLRDKMQEYIDNGARLGWLINPETRTVEIYEPGEEVETLYNPERVAGAPVLPGFLLNMKRVWG